MSWGQGYFLDFAAKGLAGPLRTLGPQGESHAAGGASASAPDTSHPTYQPASAGRASGPKPKPAMGAPNQPQAGRQAPTILAAQRAVEPPPVTIEIPNEGLLIGTLLQFVGQPKYHMVGHFKSVIGSFDIQVVPRPTHAKGGEFDILIKAAHGGYIPCGFGKLHHVPMMDGRVLRCLMFYVDDPAFPERIYLIAKPLAGWDIMGVYLVREVPEPGAQAIAAPTQCDLPLQPAEQPQNRSVAVITKSKGDTSANPMGGTCNTPLQKYTGVEQR